MKPEPKWVSYSIVIGVIIIFSSIFVMSVLNIPWWILPLLGGLILFVPWIILWKPQKGQLKLADNSLTYNLGGETETCVNYDKIQRIEFSFKHYEGQSEGILGLLGSLYPFFSGYENIVTISLKNDNIKFGVYADNQHQLKEMSKKFHFINEKINTIADKPKNIR